MEACTQYDDPLHPKAGPPQHSRPQSRESRKASSRPKSREPTSAPTPRSRATRSRSPTTAGDAQHAYQYCTYDSENEENESSPENSIAGDAWEEEGQVSAVAAEKREPGPYNQEWQVGTIGIYFGNWGNRSSSGRMTERMQAVWDTHDLQLINAPGQLIMMCEANSIVEDMLRSPQTVLQKIRDRRPAVAGQAPSSSAVAGQEPSAVAGEKLKEARTGTSHTVSHESCLNANPTNIWPCAARETMRPHRRCSSQHARTIATRSWCSSTWLWLTTRTRQESTTKTRNKPNHGSEAVP